MISGSPVRSTAPSAAASATAKQPERRRELPDFAKVAVDERRRSGDPYEEWTLLLRDAGFALWSGALGVLRWLAGKMLHYGPLPVVELRQANQGSQPRWSWRPA